MSKRFPVVLQLSSTSGGLWLPSLRRVSGSVPRIQLEDITYSVGVPPKELGHLPMMMHSISYPGYVLSIIGTSGHTFSPILILFPDLSQLIWPPLLDRLPSPLNLPWWTPSKENYNVRVSDSPYISCGCDVWVHPSPTGESLSSGVLADAFCNYVTSHSII